MDEIGDHPDEEKDVEAIINGQLASALLDTEQANLHCGVLETLADYTPLGVQDDTPKVLRLFVDKLPAKGQLVLLSEIMRYKNNPAKLRQLRDFLIQAILIPLKTHSKRKTEEDIVSPVSASSSEIERPDPLLLEIESYVDDSELRRDCLLRDGGQCVVTKWFDKGWLEKKFSGQMMPQGCMSTLDCVHIIPFSIGNSDERKQKGKIWWALWRYFPDLKGKIAPDTIDQTGNAFMVQAIVHDDFGDLEFGFERQHDSTAKYNIRWFCAWNPAIGLFKNYPEVVEFASWFSSPSRICLCFCHHSSLS
ncbi:hypothetical protein BDP81DRAFT_403904 [Colletotrichum phormii]|uniref:HNH nuclease domain-containing protein n=1 Tax=Colletotrichum phormii TaxID=359342 RepID=A0AAJ0A1Q2_9PEZI|nr:uncharacterized protein BDP81DRAFT_403904 [Colletotrichum phormii]KAK1640502.1 hypothetical protein BDP81DRAFT_403904 [Colletotrichum phormii]